MRKRGRSAWRWVAGVVVLALVGFDLSVVPSGAGAAAARSEPVDGTKASPLEAKAGPPELEPAQPEPESGPGTPPTASEGQSKPSKDFKGFDQKTSRDVPELKSERAEVFANADGSYTANVDSMPTRFKNDRGDWQQIDLSLEKKPDGKLKAKASGRGVSIAPDPKQGLAQWDSPAGPVLISLPDVAGDVQAPKPAAEPVSPLTPDPARDAARTAKWDNPKGGPSVAVKLTVGGFEQDMIIPGPGGPSSYRFTVSLPSGWTARQGPGGVQFVDGAGNVQGVFGGGRA